ncbi:hypothetical protein D3C76_893630 [compost metagenome]
MLSFIPFSFCCSVSAAFNPPVALLVFPPTIGIFSKTTTFLAPSCLACTAAESPAPPAPITTTSALSVFLHPVNAKTGIAIVKTIIIAKIFFFIIVSPCKSFFLHLEYIC